MQNDKLINTIKNGLWHRSYQRTNLWSWWRDSNPQPLDYKSSALPLCYTSIESKLSLSIRTLFAEEYTIIRPTFVIRNFLSTLLTYTHSSLSNGELPPRFLNGFHQPYKCAVTSQMVSSNCTCDRYTRNFTELQNNFIIKVFPLAATLTNNSCYSPLLDITRNASFEIPSYLLLTLTTLGGIHYCRATCHAKSVVIYANSHHAPPTIALPPIMQVNRLFEYSRSLVLHTASHMVPISWLCPGHHTRCLHRVVKY